MAGSTLTWNIDAHGFDATQRHLERLANMDVSALPPRIGEYVQRTTQERFKTQTDPQGQPWQKLKESTKAKKTRNSDKILTERGLRIVSGGTQSHVMLVDLRAKGITGKDAEAALGAAHITVNKNAIPNDPEKPMVTSGVRVGTPAMTTRGFKEDEARQTANLLADVLDAPRDEAVLAAVRAKVAALTSAFPVYGG